jgi:hyaluronan synthase
VKRTPGYVICATITVTVLSIFLFRHLDALNVSFTNFAIAYSLMFGYMALNIFASLAAKPHVADPKFAYSTLSVDVFMPIFNEDPYFIAAGLDSMTRQTRRPQKIWVVDDGSENEPLDDIQVRTAIRNARVLGIDVATHRQDNRGKRHAQAYGFERSSADIFVTVDSDTVLKDDALEELTFAFSNPETQAVGGLAAGQNHKQSLLTRTIELGFVMAFLSGRLAEGYFGAVRVNCGILAAYRGDVVRDNLARYLGQRWLGQPVNIGDDRVLTIFARERGRTDFQATAVAYSALPTSMSHLIRQRLRWARSWYWGTLWLLRRPIRTPDFWFTALQVTGMISYLIAIGFAIVGTATGQIHLRLLGYTFVASVLIGAMSTLRYVNAGRPDESVFSRVLTWLLSPLSSLLYMFLLVPLYWYAGLFLRPKGWGTRRVVEVTLRRQEEAEIAA